MKVPLRHPLLLLSSDPSNIHSHGNYMGRRRSLSVCFLVTKHAEGCFQYLFSFVCLVLVTAEFLSPFLNQILLFRVFVFVYYWHRCNLANILFHLVSGLIRHSTEAQSFHWVPFVDLGFIFCMTGVLSGKFPSVPVS